MGINQLVHDLKPKHIYQSRPGRVGSVGEVIVKTRFRQSTPDMPWAYDPYWAGSRANKLGSNVQDGHTLGYDNHGGPARTINANWNGNRSFKHQYGWVYHDTQPPDKSVQPEMSWLGDVSWRRKLAQPQIAKRTGSLFLIKPNGYNSKGVNRGGLYPVSTTAGGIEPASAEQEPTEANNPITNGPSPTNNTNAGVSRLGVQRGVYGNPRFEALAI